MFTNSFAADLFKEIKNQCQCMTIFNKERNKEKNPMQALKKKKKAGHLQKIISCRNEDSSGATDIFCE